MSSPYIGFLGTLLLHGLIVQSLPLGNARSVKPPDAQAGSIHISKGADDNNLVIIATLTPPVSGGPFATNFISPAAPKMKVVLYPRDIAPPDFAPPILPLGDDADQKSGADVGDSENQARLFGIYTGQIQARIERVWRRPRSAVNEAAVPTPAPDDVTFQCQAQIVQDSHGNVQEILLPQCSGSSDWQQSLVIAIRQASPLPAPPSESVFTNSVMLTFVGLPYSADSDEDEYQLPARTR